MMDPVIIVGCITSAAAQQQMEGLTVSQAVVADANEVFLLGQLTIEEAIQRVVSRQSHGSQI